MTYRFALTVSDNITRPCPPPPPPHSVACVCWAGRTGVSGPGFRPGLRFWVCAVWLPSVAPSRPAQGLTGNLVYPFAKTFNSRTMVRLIAARARFVACRLCVTGSREKRVPKLSPGEGVPMDLRFRGSRGFRSLVPKLSPGEWVFDLWSQKLHGRGLSTKGAS